MSVLIPRRFKESFKTFFPPDVLHRIEICSVSAMNKRIQKEGFVFLNAFFSAKEIDYCCSKRLKAEHFCARFAAKKAFLSLLNIDEQCVQLSGLEVVNSPSGKPVFKIPSDLKKQLGWNSKKRVHLSLTHEREFAGASVVIS